MELALAGLYCTLGIFLLFWCGNRLVDGSVFWAKELGVSSLFIGVAIIGFGTSFPEMVATVTAVQQDKPAIAFGNIIGSNIANIGLVLGLALLLVKNVRPTKNQLREYSFMMLAMFLLVLVIMHTKQISPVAGIIFISMLFAYLYIALQNGKKGDINDTNDDESEDLPKNRLYATGFLIVGFVGLFFGADLTIGGAITIAEYIGISERIIGLTLIALGTSLPEVAATIAAARHGNVGMTLGGVTGSNIFNVLGAGGAAALFGNMQTSPLITQDLMIMIGFGFMVAYLFFVDKPKSRDLGILLISFYFIYIISLAFVDKPIG